MIARRGARGLAAQDGVTGPRDAAEFLDVDVDELARPFALVALGGLEAETAQLAHPDPGQDPRDRRERHRERLRDLGTGEPQPPQRGDRPDPPLAGAIGDPRRRRGAIQQTELALGAEPPHPLARAADADFGGLGRLRQRPLLPDDPIAEQAPLAQAQGRVSVQRRRPAAATG